MGVERDGRRRHKGPHCVARIVLPFPRAYVRLEPYAAGWVLYAPRGRRGAQRRGKGGKQRKRDAKGTEKEDGSARLAADMHGYDGRAAQLACVGAKCHGGRGVLRAAHS